MGAETGLVLTGDMMLVMVVLIATIGLFVSELVRVDIAAIAVMVVSILAIRASSVFETALSSAVKPLRLLIVSVSELLMRTILARRRIMRSSLRWSAVGGV